MAKRELGAQRRYPFLRRQLLAGGTDNVAVDTMPSSVARRRKAFRRFVAVRVGVGRCILGLHGLSDVFCERQELGEDRSGLRTENRAQQATGCPVFPWPAIGCSSHAGSSNTDDDSDEAAKHTHCTIDRRGLLTGCRAAVDCSTIVYPETGWFITCSIQGNTPPSFVQKRLCAILSQEMENGARGKQRAV